MPSDNEVLSRLTDGELRSLLELLAASDIEELEVTVSGTRLSFRRTLEAAPGNGRAEGLQIEVGSDSDFVIAERVGFFHFTESATDGGARAGSLVTAGQRLGVIDSLNVLIPVQAPRAGRLEEVLVEEGQPVEFGQPLFVVQSAENGS